MDTARQISVVLADALLESLRRRLRSSGYLVLRRISCEQRDGAMVLRGRVPTFYMKQMAQAVLLADPRAVNVVNLIEVASLSDPLHGKSAATLSPTAEATHS